MTMQDQPDVPNQPSVQLQLYTAQKYTDKYIGRKERSREEQENQLMASEDPNPNPLPVGFHAMTITEAEPIGSQSTTITEDKPVKIAKKNTTKLVIKKKVTQT